MESSARQETSATLMHAATVVQQSSNRSNVQYLDTFVEVQHVFSFRLSQDYCYLGGSRVCRWWHELNYT